jgi:DNA-binding response OmpR family regulator
VKPRILIVDDEEAITRQLFWSLCDDYDVLTANDLPTAVRRATAYEPELSILDLHLPPNADAPDIGLRILEYIKKNVPASKVLVITSANDVEAEKACYAGGADAFLPKPFDTEQLLAAMRRMTPRNANCAGVGELL